MSCVIIEKWKNTFSFLPHLSFFSKSVLAKRRPFFEKFNQRHPPPAQFEASYLLWLIVLIFGPLYLTWSSLPLLLGLLALEFWVLLVIPNLFPIILRLVLTLVSASYYPALLSPNPIKEMMKISTKLIRNPKKFPTF